MRLKGVQSRSRARVSLVVYLITLQIVVFRCLKNMHTPKGEKKTGKDIFKTSK